MFTKWITRLVDAIFRLMSITCKDISPIISEMIEGSISPVRLWRARIHLAICSFCRHYENHLRVLTQLTKELANKDYLDKMDNTSTLEVVNPIQKPIEPTN